jgi:signal peptidase II
MGKYLYLVLIGGSTIVLDQVTKHIVQDRFDLHESVVVLDGVFSLTYILNPGAAFGFMGSQSETFRAIFFLVVSIIALTLLIIFFRQTAVDDSYGLIALSLLFGGAIGNMIDRIRLGEVVDFLDFYVGQYHWPAFNVADSAITIGVSIMMLHLFFEKKDEVDQEIEAR